MIFKELMGSGILADIGYDLTQSGNDLVITKAGSDIASSNKVIIKDFPFSKDKAFGITLGKVRDGSDLVTKTFTNPYFPEDWIFPTKDGKGFFGIGYGTDTTFGPDKIIMFVAKFDELGNETGRQLFDYNLPSGQGRVQATDGNHILVVFNSRNTLNSIDYSTAGIALVDYSGNIAASQVVDSTDSTIAIKRSISGGSVLTKDDPNYYYYYYTTSREPQGDIIVVKLNKVTLEKEGDPIYYSLSQMGKMYEDYGTPIFTAFKPDFTLSDGTRITFKNSQYLTAEVPKYRDMRPDEITPNYDLASGSQSTNSQLSQQILTLGSDTTLEVAANPNSVAAILNLDPTTNPNSKLTFSNFDSSQVKAYATDSSQYSLDEILSGSAKTSDMQLVYGATSARRLSNSFSFEDISPFDISSTYYNDYYEGTSYGNYTDDSVVEDDDDELPDLISSPYTLLELPSNQTVILVGVNGTELAKSPHSFFLTSENITQSPTSQPSSRPSAEPSSLSLSSAQPSSQPSKQPSAIPTSEPTAQPSGQPTYLPTMTIGEIIMPTTKPSSQPSTQPTSQPSRQPFANPSVIPSYKPQAIPSFKPTSQPSSQPSAQPSIQPSAIPTGEPSSQPSIHPTYIPTIGEVIMPTTNPTSQPSAQPSTQPSDFPTGQPSTKPSRQPFANPSAIPSYKPQAIPSFKPTSQPSSEPTTQPTIQDTTNPSSQPTAKPSEQLNSDPTTQPSSNPTSFPTKSTRNPSSQPTHHPIAGDLEANPTSQPSGNPSLHPRQSPSFKPQAIPSFKPTQQPVEEIRSKSPTTAPTENLRTARPTTFNPVTTTPTIANTDLETGFVTKYPTSLPSPQFTQLRQGTNSSPNFMETPGGIGVAVGAALLLTAAGLRWLFRKGEPRVNPENANAVPVAQTRGGREN